MRNSAAGPQRRVLVATAVSDATRRSLGGLAGVSVRAELADDPAALTGALVALRPDTLVVGANRVGADAMAAWTAAHDRGRLVIVRRGTSLAAIDLDAAARHGIEVLGTPGVDARHAAAFVADVLLTATPSLVGLIGAGAVNGRVAAAAVAQGHHVFVCSPALAAAADAGEARLRWMERHGIAATAGVTVAQDVHAVFAVADLLSVAVPLTAATRGLIGDDEIRAFGGSRLVCVSEPEVFTAAAVAAAHARPDVSVVFDGTPAAIGELRHRMAARGGPGWPRPDFRLSSAATDSPECDADLDQAALTAAAVHELAGLPARGAGPARASGETVVVGGGIVGLTMALALREGGRDVVLLDAAPAGRTDPAHRAATYRGADAHHLSLTETLPHATPRRRDALRRAPSDGGWRVREPGSLDTAELAWSAAFEAVAERPGLRSLADDLTVGINRFGLAAWEALLRRHPAAFAALRIDRRPARLHLTAAGPGRPLDAAEVRRRWPGLLPAVADGTVVDSDGLAVNAHGFADAVRALAEASGVRVRAASPVRRLHARPRGVDVELLDGTTLGAAAAVVTVGGRDLADLLGGDARSAGTVQHVLGVFVTVRNPGLRHPLKVHAPDPLGDVNLTLSPDGTRLHASGGFGFLGLARPQVGEPAVQELTKALEDLLGRLFPGPLTVLERRQCERAMTPDGLPVVEPVEAFDGRVVVAGGTNAGGTVQAPTLARLVELLLDARPGIVHRALHPDRATLSAFARSAA